MEASLDLHPLSMSASSAAVLLALGVPPLMLLIYIYDHLQNVGSGRICICNAVLPRLQILHYVASVAKDHSRASASDLEVINRKLPST